MDKIEKLENEVSALSDKELAKFPAWFLEFDWKAWVRDLERDIEGGKLDALAEKTLRGHQSGHTTPI